MLETYEYSLTPSQEAVVVPCLTDVPLPMELDMRNSEEVIKFLRALIFEEAARGKGYRGAFLFGSLSRRDAHNGSDIDLIHVVDSDYTRANTIRARLSYIFWDLYGIPTSPDYRPYVWLDEALSFDNYSDRETPLTLLGQESVIMVRDERLRGEITRSLCLGVLPPFSENREEKLHADRILPPKKLNMDWLLTGVNPRVRLW